MEFQIIIKKELAEYIYSIPPVNKFSKDNYNKVIKKTQKQLGGYYV